MSLSSNSLIPVHISTESIGCGTSALIHLIGAIAALSTVSTQPDLSPRLSGDITRVALVASFAEVESPQCPFDAQPVDYRVTITPEKAIVADRTYRLTATDVSEPTKIELELVRQLAEPFPIEVELKRNAYIEDRPTLPDSSQKPVVDGDRPTTKDLRQTRPSAPSTNQDASVGVRGNTPPVPMNNRPPTYPARALADRLEGTVTLRLSISSEGAIDRLEIDLSSGYSVLDASAISAVRSWRFVPAKQNGRPVAMIVYLPIRFVLED